MKGYGYMDNGRTLRNTLFSKIVSKGDDSYTMGKPVPVQAILLLKKPIPGFML